MLADNALYDSVDIVGFHYRTDANDSYVKLADDDEKEVWYSEGCATFGYTELQENKQIAYGKESIGGFQSPLALCDSFITAFASSRRTHYIFQPAIGSFYEGIQYGHKELLSARDPWSGYIHYDPALYMLEHFTAFAKTGWEDSDDSQNEIWRVVKAATHNSYAGTSNEHQTAGIDGDAGYMTMAAPDKSDFSVVFVNNTQNEKKFHITAEDMKLSTDKLHFWLTETDDYMQEKGMLSKDGDGWDVTLPAYSIATATTLDTKPKQTPAQDIHNEDRWVLDTDETGAVNSVITDDVLYADDFDYAYELAKNPEYLKERGFEPRYMLDTHGAWIVENGMLKQELTTSVGQWNKGDPSTIVGDFRWMDYEVSTDVDFGEITGNATARLTTRAQTGMNWDNSGYTLCINNAGAWELYRVGNKLASGSVEAKDTYNLKLTASGQTITAEIDGEEVSSYDDINAPMLSGRVKLSSTWNKVGFDNLRVSKVDGGIPYATTMIDGQDDNVTYEGDWKIENPGSGSADNWYRTMSVTSTAGAAFSFPVKGYGFSLLGGNNGTAKLDIYVDDKLVDSGESTYAAPARGEFYSRTDLENGDHIVKVVVKSGTVNLDAIYAIAQPQAKETTDPGNPTPGNPTPENPEPQNPDPKPVNPTPAPGSTQQTQKTVLAAGTVTTVGDASYQVTKSDVTAPTVAYRQATDKSAKKVTVPSNVVISGVTYKVTAIADNAFKGNKKLTLVTIPTTVVTIGKNAFGGCTALKKVVIPAGVTTIGANAFKGAKYLKKITVKSTVLKKIGKNAFKGIYKKAAVKVPKKQKKAYAKLLKKSGLPSGAKIK